jgi:hypothetical protein
MRERPWQDSNLQPPVPETGALSIVLQGLWGDRRELNPSIVESQTTVLPLHHDRHGTGCCPQRRRRDSNPQPRVKRRLVSTELQYRSATPPGILCEWRIGESNPWPPACKAGALPTELIPLESRCGCDGIRTRIFPLDKWALSPMSCAANVVVREGIEPPPSAVSERRSQPTELPDTGTPCGTRTRSTALKGQQTNPYPNGAWLNHCAASSGLEPELPGTKVRWATDYPTRHGVSSLTRQDSNLRCARRDLNPLCHKGGCFTGNCD